MQMDLFCILEIFQVTFDGPEQKPDNPQLIQEKPKGRRGQNKERRYTWTQDTPPIASYLSDTPLRYPPTWARGPREIVKAHQQIYFEFWPKQIHWAR